MSSFVRPFPSVKLSADKTTTADDVALFPVRLNTHLERGSPYAFSYWNSPPVWPWCAKWLLATTQKKSPIFFGGGFQFCVSLARQHCYTTTEPNGKMSISLLRTIVSATRSIVSSNGENRSQKKERIFSPITSKTVEHLFYCLLLA